MRLFVALYPPAPARQACLTLLDGLALPPGRAAAVAQLHITALFIGEVDPRQLDSVRQSVERAAAGLPAFTLTPRRMIALPEKAPARLVALETDAPAPLPELHERLVKRLARPSERRLRAFLPHLTLYRFSAPTRFEMPALPAPGVAPFPIERVALVRSHLQTGGAEHEVIHEVSLLTR